MRLKAGQCLAIVSGLIAVFGLPAGTFASDETEVIEVHDTVLIPAGTYWDSPSKSGEIADFDIKVKFNQRFEITTFDSYIAYRILIHDMYTNMETGLKFFDTADYYIRQDLATGEAFHAGVFWNVKYRGQTVVLDTGTFAQDWNGEYPWPVLNLTGPDHDVNAYPFGTISYVDWLMGDFPRDPGKKETK